MRKIADTVGKFFCSFRGRAYTNGICSLAWAAMAASATTPVIAGLSGLAAALFGVTAGMALSDHFNEQMTAVRTEIIDRQSSLINQLTTELIAKEKAA